MKKIYALLSAFAFCTLANAQFSFSDDFETYAVGDYIGSNSSVWTTWSGATGGAEDAQVTDANANASSNSIYFESTSANGGPQDVVLDFGEVFTSGDFVFESDFYVNQSAGAYFNFQAESVIGTTWALDCHMDNGILAFKNDAGAVVLLETDYVENAWFTLRMEMSLTTNNWEVFVDGISVGSFANGETQIASIDIFPLEGNEFYVDNISVSHMPYVLQELNAAMILVNPIDGLVTQERYATVEVKNLGLNTINSFDIVLNYAGAEFTESVTSTSLASLEGMTIDFSTPIVLGDESDVLSATISNVNGGIDDDASDDTKIINVNAVKPADGKIVIAEEGTGTWCGWCPRGTVAMDLMARDFDGYYQGIAIHNGDPMELAVYDQDLEVSGYPSALVDRVAEIDPGAIKVDFMERILVQPSGVISNGAVVNGDSLDVSLTVDFNMAVSGNWKIVCVLTEDNVSGTGSGYAQANSYSGGDAGDLVAVDGTNWADLSNNVSASSMVYNHVARALSPSFDGYAGFPNSVEIGSTYTFNFKFGLDENWKTEDMHIVGMLIGADTKIDNGSSTKIDDAITSGFVSGTNVLSTTELSQFDDMLNVYPNPASAFVKLSLNLKEAKDLQIRIVNIMGQELASRNYSSASGAQIVSLNVSDYPKGVYIVELIADGVHTKKQFVKQ